MYFEKIIQIFRIVYRHGLPTNLNWKENIGFLSLFMEILLKRRNDLPSTNSPIFTFLTDAYCKAVSIERDINQGKQLLLERIFRDTAASSPYIAVPGVVAPWIWWFTARQDGMERGSGLELKHCNLHNLFLAIEPRGEIFYLTIVPMTVTTVRNHQTSLISFKVCS